MNEDLGNIQYSPIRDYPYAKCFQEVQYNGKSLNATERKEFISVADKTIARYAKGLTLLKRLLEDNRNKQSDAHEVYSILLSVLQFVQITMIDSIVISKYFILADNDYDRRFMRGKMKVILNEGFKKLYGFNEGKQSKWNDIGTILKFFPEKIHSQYQELSYLLEKHSKSSSWWKDERDVETHLDADKLYDSRCEDIEESKVMMESLKLYDTLFAVDAFLINMHACFRNFLIDKYKQGKLREE